MLLASALLACGTVAPPGPSDPVRPAEGGSESSSTLLITGGTVVTVDPRDRIIPDGAVAVAKGRIVAVGTTAALEARYPAAPRLDARGAFVIPGLVNTHTHVPMVLFRGLADDLELMDWLENHIFPAEARHVDEEFVRWGTRLACAEMLRAGTTTFVEMYYFDDVIAEEAERCGMRAVVGETLIDFPAPDNKTWDEAVAYTRRFVKRWRGHERIVPAVAPHSPYLVSAEHLRQTQALAVELDAPLLMHVAEDRSEVATMVERTGMTSIAYLDSLGLATDRLLAAHVVWPTPEEIALLAERGIGVAHCPQSNMKVAAGIAPVPALLDAGVAVGLGTDGAASNNDLNLWEEMDTAAKIHKVTARDPTVVSAREAFRMATIGGAAAIDLDAEIGSIEVGKWADLVVVGADGIHQEPQQPEQAEQAEQAEQNTYSTLVYSTKASDVRTVLVAGQILVDGGEVRSVDLPTVAARARAYREAIRAGRSNP